MSNIVSAYNQYYAKAALPQVYPVEFVVRTFLGSYPNLRLNKSEFAGKRILDLGYGDGRNIPLMHDLGFNVFGVEISEEISQMTKKRMQLLDVPVELKTGHNSHIPFPNEFFQYVLACHACYYVLDGQTFTDNLNEIHRVLDTDGAFICSLPMKDSYILEGATDLGDGHYQIQNDPYKLRNGTIFRAFSNEQEIKDALSNHFTDFRIGFCDDNFYGIHQKVWIVTCWKKTHS